MANAFTIDQIVQEFGAFYQKGSQGYHSLFRGLMQIPVTLKLAGINHIKTDDTIWRGANPIVGSFLQPYQEGFTPKGKVVCLEISRLGRNTLEALKVIKVLNENGVSLYVKNYNLETLTPDGKVNPVASLICTILLEIASMERLTIKERMASGRDQYIANCRRDGVKMGRPSTYRKSEDAYKQQYAKEISLLKKGISLRNIAAITGTSVNTLRKIHEKFC